jgi:hypothetical protein
MLTAAPARITVAGTMSGAPASGGFIRFLAGRIRNGLADQAGASQLPETAVIKTGVPAQSKLITLAPGPVQRRWVETR